MAEPIEIPFGAGLTYVGPGNYVLDGVADPPLKRLLGGYASQM